MDKKKKIRVLSLFDGMACTRIALDKLGFKDVEYFASEIDPYAIKVAKDNYPDIIHIGDVTKIDAKKIKELGEIDLLIGGSPCFPAGTLVFTKNGYKPIELLQVGDEVLTHKGRFRKILDWGYKKSNKLVKIKAFGLDNLESTPNHPYYVRLLNTDGTYSLPFWEKASNLTYKHYIASTSIIENNAQIFHSWDYSLSFLMGRYLANGHVVKSKNKTVLFCNQKEKSLFEEKLNDLKLKYQIDHQNGINKIIIDNNKFYDFALKMNRGLNKKINFDFFQDNKEMQNEFVSGYLSSDKKHTNPHISFGLKFLLLNNYEKRQEDVLKINTLIMPKSSENESFFEDGTHWVPVDTINNVELKDSIKVYNIEVEEDNSYTANSMVVHNCQGFSRSGKGLNFDDPRSKLFFNYVEILKKLKPKYFVLENVHMKEEWQDVISSFLEVKPILLNSNLISAQNRPRLYWTNIPDIKPPKDKGIYFQDIMEHNAPDNYYYSEAGKAWMKRHSERKNKKVRELNAPNVKMQCLEASMFKNYSSQRFFQVTDVKGPRYITVKECERCQQVPDDYTKAVSNTQRYKMLGNSFSVDMIAHLIKHIFNTKK